MELTFEGLSADDRLAKLGLNKEDLWNAVDSGRHYKANLTAHDTTAVRGMGIWNAINRALADLLVPRGWKRIESGNFPLTVHPKNASAIAVLAGNRATGLKTEIPVNGYSLVGKRNIVRAISHNSQVVRPYTHLSSFDPHWGPKPRLTYFLLHYIDRDAQEMRAELSLAVGRLEDNISEWYERIVFSAPKSWHGLEEDEEQPIEVPITEKSAKSA